MDVHDAASNARRQVAIQLIVLKCMPSTSLTSHALAVLVERATDPMTHEPNYAVNLELAELINNKKANT
jgi:hypothetical protein